MRAADTDTTSANLTLPPRSPVSTDRLALSHYGMSIFIWNNPSTTGRDLQALEAADFGWQKTGYKAYLTRLFSFNQNDILVQDIRLSH